MRQNKRPAPPSLTQIELARPGKTRPESRAAFIDFFMIHLYPLKTGKRVQRKNPASFREAGF